MSESNALLQKLGGVPTLSAGDQVLVNPLAAITAGNQAAQSEFETRNWQAKQAAGQAYQGAINKDGEFDSNKFRTLLSQSGPAALQAGTALANTQNMSSDELNQQKLKFETFNATLGSLMEKGNNVTHSDVVAGIQSLMAHKQMTLPEAQRIMGTIPAEQGELAGWVKQHALTVAGASTRFDQTIGTRQTFSTPGATYNAPVPPPGMGQPTVAIPHGPGPGETQQGGIWVDAKGAQVPEGTPGAVWQEGVTPKTRMPQFQQGGPPTFIPGSGPFGTGRPPAGSKLLNPNKAPVTPAPAPPGPQSSLQTGGAQVASVDPSMVPQTGAPDAPSPMAASNVADIQAGMAQARANPRPEGTQTASDTRSSFIPTAPPQGQPERLKADQETYRADQAAIPSVMTRAQNTAKAYEALRLLKEMDSTTGVGAGGWQAFRSRMGTLGLLPDSSMKVQQQQEEFAKYTEKLMLDAAGGGSTNLGKEMAAHSNPSNLLSMAANFDVLRADLGKVLQNAAAQMSHENKDGGGYLGYRSDIATKTDPRGFVWDTYDKAEQDKIFAEAEVAKDGGEAVKRLKRAIGLSHEHNLRIPGATQPPPSEKRSFQMPPMPVRSPMPGENPLLMVG